MMGPSNETISAARTKDVRQKSNLLSYSLTHCTVLDVSRTVHVSMRSSDRVLIVSSERCEHNVRCIKCVEYIEKVSVEYYYNIEYSVASQ